MAPFPRMKRAIALCLLILSVGCRDERPAARREVTATASGAAQPKQGGTLVRRLASDINTLNFVLHTTSSEKFVLGYLHDPIVAYDKNLKIVPALAKRWQVSPDGKTYTFTLDERARFSDGTPVRASDVLFTLRKIVDPKSPSPQLAGLFESLNLDQTRVVDDQTISVVFDTPRAAQLDSFNIAVLPEHVYGGGDFANDYNERVVGTGPYLFVSRNAGTEIVLARRQDYWRKPAFIDRIVFKVLSDDSVAWNAMKQGEIDEMRITADQYRLDGQKPAVRDRMNFHRFYLLSYNFIPWNLRSPILSDKRVRRALAMMLDRRSIVRNVYHGNARIMTGPFTEDQWAFNSAVKPIEFDPAGAKKLLAAAGWSDRDGDGTLDRDGKPLKVTMLLVAGNKPSADQAQVFQSALKDIGVRLDLVTMDGATFFKRVSSGDYESAFLAWNLDADPDLYTLFHSSQFVPDGQNLVFYSNPRVDELIMRARAELDQQKRAALYRELHAILADDQPYTWTVQLATTWAVNKRVRGVEEGKGFGLFYWEPGPRAWWLASGSETAPSQPPQPQPNR